MKNFFKAFLFSAMLFFVSCSPSWEQLFNGKDFTGWEVYIGVPDPSVDIPGMDRNEDGEYTQPLGLENDPLQVFTIVEIDGAPAIRASGQIYGSFATVKEYGNYHLKLQAKWGEMKWAPREDKPRNAGVLYHGIGDFGKGLNVWKISHECQVMETMFGDSYRMGETYCDITASRTNENERYMFDRSASKQSFGHGLPAGPICSKDPMKEKNIGEWNSIEVLCYEGTSVHIINGVVNMINTNSHTVVNGNEIPLTKGVIQLQSEGAEIYYRNIEIRSISNIPDEYLK